MLLQRLAEYADRARESEPESLPPPYYRLRPVRWVILLDDDGTPTVPEMKDLSDDKHPSGNLKPVPYIQRSGVRPPPMLLADDLRYVTGFAADDAERERGEPDRKNSEFIGLVNAWRESAPGDPVAAAVASFYRRGLHRELAAPPSSAKAADVAAIMVGSQWAHERPSAAGFWAGVVRERKSSAVTGICLVCGVVSPLLRLILARSPDHPRKESYMTGLDPDLPSLPYQCGRMFAVLEDIQRAALGRDVNTTIADKYLPAASSTPLAILTMLRKNANGHLKRIRRTNAGAYFALSGRLDEVIEHISPNRGIPATQPVVRMRAMASDRVKAGVRDDQGTVYRLRVLRVGVQDPL